MRLVILNTFLTLVDDDAEATCMARTASGRCRRHSAPATFTYPVRAVCNEPVVCISQKKRKQQKKKELRAQRTTAAAAAAADDDAVLMEAIERAKKERQLHGGENVGSGDAEPVRLRCKQARGRSNLRVQQPPGTRMRFHFRGPGDVRPPNAIFVLKENYGEIGFAYDPSLCTTGLRRMLIHINGRSWNDDYVVTTLEGQIVPVASTLGEEKVMSGTRFRLSSPVRT